MNGKRGGLMNPKVLVYGCLLLTLWVGGCKPTIDKGLETAVTGNQYAQVVKGTPYIGQLVIDGGSPSTSSSTVVVTLIANDDLGVDRYWLSTSSNTPSVFDSGWVRLSGTRSDVNMKIFFDLGSQKGTVTVYAWVDDLEGNISAAASATIEYK